MSQNPVLVIVGSPHLGLSEVRQLEDWATQGARIVAWQHPAIVQERFPSPDVAASLDKRNIPAMALAQVLGEEVNNEVDDAVIAWMKAFGRAPLTPSGESFRSIFRYRHLSLWWWAELFLYHDTPLRLLVRDVEALARLVERERPARLVVVAPVRVLAAAARALVKETEVHGETIPARSKYHASLHFAGALLKTLGTGLKSALRRGGRKGSDESRECRRHLFVTHASMWRERPSPQTGKIELVEMYFDQVPTLLASDDDVVEMVAFGPPIPYKIRGLRQKLEDIAEKGEEARPYVSIREYFDASLVWVATSATWDCWRMWRRFCRLPLVSEALRHRGVALRDGALESFRDTFLLQLPWALRSYHEIRTVLLAEKSDLIVLYAESSGLGRAAIAAAHELGVATFAVQHGIMYPRYYSHEHAAHEVSTVADGGESVPIPMRTAVFGSMARDLLETRSRYPSDRIVITGSPKFDALVESAGAYDPAVTRSRLGFADDVPMLVVATRFNAIGPVFEELVRAAEAIPDLGLVVKPHQAEPSEPYREIVRLAGASRTRILEASENLLELLVASDGLITVDSLASSEALVLGRRVLIVNLPNNLGVLVERGVALGAWRGESIEQRLRELVLDPVTASKLEKRREEYIKEFAFGADGRSTERIVQAIRETADARRRNR